MATAGHFDAAVFGIFGAMIADGLDGRVARLTNTQTDFGKEYDSLCDMVAFGVAPAVLIWAFSLHYLADYRWIGGKLGWVIAFAYAACAALRLARFNVLAAIASSDKDFYGVPSPAAAAGRSEEHTSELQSLMRISYAVFCLKKKTNISKHKNGNELLNRRSNRQLTTTVQERKQ